MSDERRRSSQSQERTVDGETKEWKCFINEKIIINFKTCPSISTTMQHCMLETIFRALLIENFSLSKGILLCAGEGELGRASLIAIRISETFLIYILKLVKTDFLFSSRLLTRFAVNQRWATSLCITIKKSFMFINQKHKRIERNWWRKREKRWKSNVRFVWRQSGVHWHVFRSKMVSLRCRNGESCPRPSELTAARLPTIAASVKSRLWSATEHFATRKSFAFINLTTNTAHSVTPLTFMHIIKHAVIICIGSLGRFIKWTCFIHTSDRVCVSARLRLAAAEIIHLKISSNGFNSLSHFMRQPFLLLFSINQRDDGSRGNRDFRNGIDTHGSEIVSHEYV